jgi:hypothetical protein
MIPIRGRIGAGEATLPRALHRAPRQKTPWHTPRLTHRPAVESNLRLGLPQHTSDLSLGGRSTLDPPTPLTSPPATHHLKPNNRPRSLSLDPNKLSHPTGYNCAHRAVHTHQSHTHTPKVILNAPYTSQVHYDRVPGAFYVTSSGKPLHGAARLLPGQDICVVPRLLGKGVGEKRKSGRIARLDMNASLASLRTLVADTLMTLVPRPDQTHCSMSSEGAQRVKVQLTALHQKAQTEHHVLCDDLRRLVAAAATKPLNLHQEDLKELHAASTPCRGLHRMRPRLFCQPSCRHTV